MQPVRPRVLIVDDKPSNLRLVSDILGDGYDVRTAPHGDAALASVAVDEPDVVVSDIRMPKTDGLSLLATLKARHPTVEVVLMTAFGSISKAVEAVKLGAFDYLTKPLDPDQVLQVVDRAIQSRRLAEAAQGRTVLTDQRDHFGPLLGSSPAMQRLFSLLDRAAKSEATVLILGDSGTGKEVAARALHGASPRANGPFVPVNCGALPRDLIESELFGHSQGAFTGAQAAAPGLFAAAEGGVLFLDEVGELALDLQVKLNRVLQEHAVRAVGSTGERAINVRVLAATNRDLKDEVRQGRFREDLYYRLNVFTLQLPDLRSRQEDIPQLALHFLSQSGGPIQRMSPETLSALVRYSWPGNVRELENVIARALTLADGETLSRQDLPADVLGDATSEPGLSTELAYKEAVELARDRASRDYLVELMRQHRGNVTRAADTAGMERESLHRLLKRHGIQPQAFRGET